MVGDSLVIARALLARVALKERILRLDLDSDPRWLTLPPRQRERLLNRHEALEAYDRLAQRTAIDAQRLAQSVGMKIDNFHRLFRIWQEGGRGPLAIAPYSSLKTDRPTRLAPGTADAIMALIDHVLEVDPLAMPRKVIAYVKENWEGPGDLPSDVTLRNLHDKAILDRQPKRGSLTINFPDAPQEQAVEATALAEVLVVDHTAPGRVHVDGRICVTPTITLAIDLWSGVPVGAAVTVGKPCAAAVVEALEDARRRLRGLGQTGARVRPRIVLASTFSRQWDGLREWLLDHEIDLVERRGVNLHHGGPTKRIIGTKLGELELQPRLAGRPPKSGTIDTEKVAVLDAKQLLVVIDAAIDDLIGKRLGDLQGGAGIDLDIPEERPALPTIEQTDVVERGVGDDQDQAVLARVRSVVGHDFVAARIVEKGGSDGQMRVEVTIAADAARTELWLDLAAEAIAMRKELAVMVEFELRTANGGGAAKE